MGIDFSPERWSRVKTTYNLWWEGRLERPVTGAILYGKDPARPEPSTPLLSQSNCTDLDIPVGDIIDRLDYELSTYVFLGDAFPFINLDVFGPGLLAAFCGAIPDNSSGRMWFHPREKKDISHLRLEYDPDNIWLKRVKDLCREAMARWQGQVLVGMPDLGGTLDILASFRTTEDLLMDLYDSPEEVNRLIWEINELWHNFYNEINCCLQPYNPAYSDWSRIISDTPLYVLQSDFSYMISPSMFDTFVKPELAASCRKLSRSTYHLDGVGQLAHLDSLLEIQELDCIQWVPGDGQPPQSCWPEVYQKIHAAGKKIQVLGDFSTLDTVIGQIGTGNCIQHMPVCKSVDEETAVRKQLLKYGIE